MDMIKKIALSILLAVGAGQLQAQELYNEVLSKAEKVVNDPKADEVSIKVNHFKSTALRYLRHMAVKDMPEVSAQFLDVQAYYLTDFLSKFFKDMAAVQNDKTKARKECIIMYVNASVGNPLFESADTETAESFIDDKDNLTPFSLNTDWEKACQAIDYQKKKDK